MSQLLTETEHEISGHFKFIFNTLMRPSSPTISGYGSHSSLYKNRSFLSVRTLIHLREARFFYACPRFVTFTKSVVISSAQGGVANLQTVFYFSLLSSLPIASAYH